MFETSQAGLPYSHTVGEPGPNTYPKSSTYQFQEFAGLVIELGGYGDITLIDPYTGSRLWVGDVFKGDTFLFDALRKAMDVAEEVGFMSIPKIQRKDV